MVPIKATSAKKLSKLSLDTKWVDVTVMIGRGRMR
jgi:hypothetical protein